MTLPPLSYVTAVHIKIFSYLIIDKVNSTPKIGQASRKPSIMK